MVFISSYSGCRRLFPNDHCRESWKNILFTFLFFFIAAAGAFFQYFTKLKCLSCFQGYGPGHRFVETLPYVHMYIYIYMYINLWQYLVCWAVKKRARTTLPKSARQLCSHLVCLGFSLCDVQFWVCVMCSRLSVLCAGLSWCYVQFSACVICSF